MSAERTLDRVSRQQPALDTLTDADVFARDTARDAAADLFDILVADGTIDDQLGFRREQMDARLIIDIVLLKRLSL